MGLDLAPKSPQPQKEFLAKPLGGKRPCVPLFLRAHAVVLLRKGRKLTRSVLLSFEGPFDDLKPVRVTGPLPE